MLPCTHRTGHTNHSYLSMSEPPSPLLHIPIFATGKIEHKSAARASRALCAVGGTEFPGAAALTIICGIMEGRVSHG
jgi:hypothetical protein